jgi:hypothetical protein
MKQLISLKQFLYAGLIISAIIFNGGCQKNYMQPAPDLSSGSTDLSKTGRIYLDLTKDQVIPGGVTNAMLQNYLNHGYQLHSLAADEFVKHVEFKNSDGNIYYQNGWLKKGTKYLLKSELQPGILMMCGNDFWPEVD